MLRSAYFALALFAAMIHVSDHQAQTTIDLSRPLTQAEAQALYRLGEEVVIQGLLLLSAKLVSPNEGEASPEPNTPS